MTVSSWSRGPIAPFSGRRPITWKFTRFSLMIDPTGEESPNSSRATVAPTSATFLRPRTSSSVKKRPAVGEEARIPSYSTPVPSTCVFQFLFP